MVKHLISLKNYSEIEILDIISLAQKIKKQPKNYSTKLKGKTLLMLFAKPSLRTRLSFEIAMLQLGGHAIFYDIANSPLGKKESIKDGAKVISRFCDAIMARLFEHKDMQELAEYSNIPVISGLDNQEHPCQILGDLLTIKEKFKKLNNLTIAYLGDANNNITHSLIYACKKLRIKLIISCPNRKKFLPNKELFTKKDYIYIKKPKKAVLKADIIYTDTYQSYHIPENEIKSRVRKLKKYQINEKLFNINKKALFMHCLPAVRGEEVTDEVIDSKRSIVYDQASNRLPIQQAILLKLLKY